jgi:hypothetical protein
MRALRRESDLVRAVGNSALALAAVSGAYWFSLRPRHLRWGASDAEVARRWPGDEFVPSPHTRSVRAVTVNAPAERVWPWIMQVDRERGGFYSYTWLENLIGANIHNKEHMQPGKNVDHWVFPVRAPALPAQRSLGGGFGRGAKPPSEFHR